MRGAFFESIALVAVSAGIIVNLPVASRSRVEKTVALLLQGNSNSTSAVAKEILMYTERPLAGFNTLEQSAGEIKQNEALRLTRSMRDDLKTRVAISF